MKQIISFIILLLMGFWGNAQTTVGAIRWDGWTGTNNSVGQHGEVTLGQDSFHYRVPFYGKIVGPDSVTINACQQSIMDSEINYAAKAGLNYWAFVWYAASSGLDQSRNLYMKSVYKQSINYCLIIEPDNWVTNISIDSIVNDFKQTNYQKVMGNRPLLYLLGYSGILKSDVDSLRARTIRAGFGTPYIVEMRVDGVLNTLSDLGLDAFSMYAVTWMTGGVTYDSLANTDIAQWNWIAVNNNLPLVPHVTSGWDNRPRHYDPVSWAPDPGLNSWVQQATPAQIANHITDAKNWIASNSASSPANTVIVYAWNEFDEGGWLCPNLPQYGGTLKVNAVGNLLGSRILPP